MSDNPTGNQPDSADMPEFSIGFASDGAVFLMDGQPLTINEVLQRLKRGASAERLVALIAETIQAGDPHGNSTTEAQDQRSLA